MNSTFFVEMNLKFGSFEFEFLWARKMYKGGICPVKIFVRVKSSHFWGQNILDLPHKVGDILESTNT